MKRSFWVASVVALTLLLQTQARAQLTVEGPADVTIYNDAGSVALRVYPCDGVAPFAFDWKKDGVSLSPEQQPNGPTLRIDQPASEHVGSYSCSVTDSGTPPESGESQSGVLSIVPHVECNVTPLEASLVEGGTWTLSAVTTGGYLTGPDYYYRWLKDGSDIGGSTATLELRYVNTGDAGSYVCEVTDDLGGVATSSPAVVTVLAVASGPIGGAPSVGGAWSFTVSTTGGNGLPLAYQWFHDGAPAGPNASTWSLTSLTTADSGFYWAEITQGGTATTLVSAATSLAVGADPIVIASQPAPATAYQGESVSFSVGVTVGGVPPYAYQWQRDVGSGFLAIAGASSSAFAISSAISSDAGRYRCAISDSQTPAPQTIVTDTVPLNMYLPLVITRNPVGNFDPYFLYFPGETRHITFAVAACGGKGPLHYQWMRQPYCEGPFLDMAGKTAAAWSVDIVDWGWDCLQCRVWDDTGQFILSSVAYRSTVLCGLFIDICPTNGVAHEDSSHTFTTSMYGCSDTPFYQWYFDDGSGPVALLGATTTNLTIDPVEPDDAGMYHCEGVACSYYPARTTTFPVTLTVIPPFDFYIEPQGGAVDEGNPFEFEVEVLGAVGAVHYQWKLDNGLPTKAAQTVGTDSPILTITSASTADAGLYWVEVTDDYTTIVSNKASLKVGGYGLPTIGHAALAATIAVVIFLGAFLLLARRRARSREAAR